MGRVLATLYTAQGIATFRRRTLDMRDDHPAKNFLTGLCAVRLLRPTIGICRPWKSNITGDSIGKV